MADLRFKQDQVFSDLESLKDDSRISVVTTDSDYYTDPRMCLTMVHLLPETLKDKINRLVIEPLRKADPSQFYIPPTSLHFTVQNVKVISTPVSFTEEDIVSVNSLQDFTSKHDSLSYSLEGLYRLRLSVGVKAFPNDLTHDLILNLRKKLLEIGVPDDKMYLNPDTPIGNISLCRFYQKPNDEFFRVFEEVKNIKFGNLDIPEFNLLVSNAACNADTRKVVGTFNLR